MSWSHPGSRPILGVAVIVDKRSTNRRFIRLATFALLALACCVFAWGLQYKLSLYASPHSTSHQMPAAKLLSKNEQSAMVQSPLIALAKTSAKVIYTVPSTGFPILFLALSPFNPSFKGSREESAIRSWSLRQRAFRKSVSGVHPATLRHEPPSRQRRETGWTSMQSARATTQRGPRLVRSGGLGQEV